MYVGGTHIAYLCISQECRFSTRFDRKGPKVEVACYFLFSRKYDENLKR